MYHATQYPSKNIKSLIPFIDATTTLIIKNANVTEVNVCQNLFLPVNFKIEKYDAAFIAIHKTNNVAEKNCGIKVIIADKYGINPVPPKSVAVNICVNLISLSNMFIYVKVR